MKRKFFLLFSLMSQVVFSQVGINTPSPTKTLDVNGDMRIRNVSSTNSDNIDFLVKDNEGNISSVSRSFFSQSVSGVLSNIFYLQGTNPVTINVGSTSAVPGLAFNYTIKKGKRRYFYLQLMVLCGQKFLLQGQQDKAYLDYLMKIMLR